MARDLARDQNSKAFSSEMVCNCCWVWAICSSRSSAAIIPPFTLILTWNWTQLYCIWKACHSPGFFSQIVVPSHLAFLVHGYSCSGYLAFQFVIFSTSDLWVCCFWLVHFVSPLFWHCLWSFSFFVDRVQIYGYLQFIFDIFALDLI